MNVSEDYDEKVEHWNTHPDLLPQTDNKDKLLPRDSAVLVKALEPRVVPRDIRATVKAIRPQVVKRGTVASIQAINPQVVLRKASKNQEKAISS